MKRRDFIKNTVPAIALPAVFGGFQLNAYSQSSLLQKIAKAAASTGRIFVIIQLNGGNDGLNTIIPIDQYSNLSNARNNILIPEKDILALSNTNKTGMHPKMTGLRTMYDDSQISVIQSVGYPDPNFSHFRSTDIWLSASDSDKYVPSGWAGRYLDNEFPDYPDGFPNADMPHPLAIQIGYAVSPVFQGSSFNMGIATSDPNSFYNFINGTVPQAPNTPAGHELTYLRLIKDQSIAYGNILKDTAAKGKNMVTYPTGRNASLAEQLKIVALLISGGMQTPLYMVSMGGFDTHANQIDNANKSNGSHAELLKQLSDSIKVFQDDLKTQNLDDKVAGMTFSEFGRRIKSNASFGTDHGAAAPLICFGKNVIPGIIGNNPSIASNTNVYDNVPMQYDFRQIYASVLTDWFGIDASETKTILGNNFNTLPIFKKANASIDSYLASKEKLHIKNYPNPANEYTNFEFYALGGEVHINIFDNTGKLVDSIKNQHLQEGIQTLFYDTHSMKAGNYYYQILQHKGSATGHLLKL